METVGSGLVRADHDGGDGIAFVATCVDLVMYRTREGQGRRPGDLKDRSVCQAGCRRLRAVSELDTWGRSAHFGQGRPFGIEDANAVCFWL